MSVARGLQAKEIKEPIMEHISNLITQITNSNKIHIVQVPSHCGIHGNEITDSCKRGVNDPINRKLSIIPWSFGGSYTQRSSTTHCNMPLTVTHVITNNPNTDRIQQDHCLNSSTHLVQIKYSGKVKTVMGTPKHFKERLNEESGRLEILCTTWQNILDTSKNISEDFKDQIRTAVGQTKLLLKEKLQQFRELLKNYETGKGDKSITQDDLEGFWDLVLIQVNDVNEKFSTLEATKKLHLES